MILFFNKSLFFCLIISTFALAFRRNRWQWNESLAMLRW